MDGVELTGFPVRGHRRRSSGSSSALRRGWKAAAGDVNGPAGGGYSTVEDLVRSANAVSHKLLDAKNTELLTTGKVNTARGVKYAFGFMDDDTDPAMRRFGYNGGAPGMNDELDIYPQSCYVIAVLSNLDPPAASRISDFVCNRLPKN